MLFPKSNKDKPQHSLKLSTNVCNYSVHEHQQEMENSLRLKNPKACVSEYILKSINLSKHLPILVVLLA